MPHEQVVVLAAAAAAALFVGLSAGVPTGLDGPDSHIPRLPHLSAAAEPFPRECLPEPRVLVYHTHTGETYADGGPITEVGRRLARGLCDHGIAVQHAPFVFDEPDIEGAYDRSRPVLQRLIAAHDSLGYLIDVHRDAPGPRREGAKVAGVLLVVGQDNPAVPGERHLAERVNRELISRYPELNRGIRYKAAAYNQDLPRLSLLVEIGKADNTLTEALGTADAVAEVLAAAVTTEDAPDAQGSP